MWPVPTYWIPRLLCPEFPPPPRREMVSISKAVKGWLVSHAIYANAVATFFISNYFTALKETFELLFMYCCGTCFPNYSGLALPCRFRLGRHLSVLHISARGSSELINILQHSLLYLKTHAGVGGYGSGRNSCGCLSWKMRVQWRPGIKAVV